MAKVIEEDWYPREGDTDRLMMRTPIVVGGNTIELKAQIAVFSDAANRIRLASLAPRMGRAILAFEWDTGGASACPNCAAVPPSHLPECEWGSVCDELRAIAGAT